MKKIFYILIAVLFLTSIKVYAEDATITDLSCTKKTGGVESSLTATVEGLEINVDDVVFEDAGDFMKCTFKINNTSDDDLEVDSEAISNKSDEKIKYSLTSNKGNIVKKGESNEYSLDIEYIETYSESKTIDNNIEISLVGDKISVPDTLITGIVIILYVVLLGSGFAIILLANKKSKYLVLLLLLLIIPSAYALTRVSIKMSNKIIVDTTPKYDVIYNFDDDFTPLQFLLTENDVKSGKYINAEIDLYYDEEKEEDVYDELYLGDNPEPYYEYYVDSYKETYKAGETVDVKDGFLNRYELFGDCDYSYDENKKAYVIKCDESDVEIEPVYFVKNNYDRYWSYISNADESDVMNFTGEGYIDALTNYDNKWEVRLIPPKTFVMPEHDVVFNLYEVHTPVK